MKTSDARTKITSEHLERMACVYVRQSSPEQVRNNRESARRQYELADRAVMMGWPRGQVRVIDEDQGQSGSLPNSRSGFLDLVAGVARGEVGIVIGLEVSRLARNSPDWSHLLYMCRWTSTLIADEHGVYDPADSADRMVLGIRGQISELERDNAIHRMVEARWNKARRGDLQYAPPAGYDLDDLDQLVMSSPGYRPFTRSRRVPAFPTPPRCHLVPRANAANASHDPAVSQREPPVSRPMRPDRGGSGARWSHAFPASSRTRI